ncbi:DUF1259 domain-containing protein [Sporomusa sp.]|uniref:DUF1259 domain-containing protein n=1 Tax=Sporomusa sp. TaxID=2078658 RepID=UPI002C1B2D81|nr:DUF1259 domain-containing protein [Sporomusa sp.]HWR45081.1 DUF1259 domain-containing protein [Sporomusa sp.]
MAIPAALCSELADILGGIGQTKNGVCNIEIPRSDISVTIMGLPSKAAPTHVITFERNNNRTLDTGALVLLQDEVKDVLAQLLSNDIIVSAVSNHWILDDPHLIYVHIQSTMEPRGFARKVAQVLDMISSPT